jgi:hypothetical protein
MCDFFKVLVVKKIEYYCLSKKKKESIIISASVLTIKGVFAREKKNKGK